MNATYPDLPGFKALDTETSRQAARLIIPQAHTLLKRCVQLLSTGDFTADEAAARLGVSILSVRPRFSELKAQGRIEATKERRVNVSGVNAVVWRARNADSSDGAQKDSR